MSQPVPSVRTIDVADNAGDACPAVDPLRPVHAQVEREAAGQIQADSLANRFGALRAQTMALVARLGPEDMVVQSMEDASPAKWHLAHTTWFFEQFILTSALPGYEIYDPAFSHLFNSYYNAIGTRVARDIRGLQTRPAVDAIVAYRAHVDAGMVRLFEGDIDARLKGLVELGLAHEEQHQELLLMDALHLLSMSPLKPSYDPAFAGPAVSRQSRFVQVPGGLVSTGHAGSAFGYDNEFPRHRVWLEPFSIAETLVTNGEWLAFVEAGGYRDPQFWLADGWDLVGREHWTAPLYWQQSDAGWLEFGLGGLRPLDPDAAVTHVSYFEAAAYANWAGVRLPTEHEWERAVGLGVIRDVDTVGWQWTQSAYSAYPGFRAEVSAVGEYNGKFMNGQMVLRGGASVTPAGHTRPTYRNFYRPGQRWMFSAVRLAGDVSQGDAGVSGSFLADALAGLSATPKTLPPKYFYDARGSALFEDICVTDEYYPTRAETALLTDVVFRLARVIPPRSVLVEFGSGASDKTVLLLDAAPQLSAYVPIDVSSDALEQAVEKLAARYADLSVTPVVADFTTLENLPRSVRSGPRVGFFPGSTIGNLARDDAQRFLGSAKTLLGHDALFVVGVDLVKDEATLVAAYNDAAGVTAEFNKNMLVRLNRELEADFDLDGFAHEARWNASLERIEMHLVSNRKQTATLAGLPVSFEKGESIHTENSHKFTVESFSSLATKAGWRIGQYWISATPSFALFLLHA